MPGAIAGLAKELLEIEATGDGDRAATWFAGYGTMPVTPIPCSQKQMTFPSTSIQSMFFRLCRSRHAPFMSRIS